jgi:hypothetical protein
MKKTSLAIPDDLWKAAKHLAIEQGVDLKDVIIQALAKHLKTQSEKKGGTEE